MPELVGARIASIEIEMTSAAPKPSSLVGELPWLREDVAKRQSGEMRIQDPDIYEAEAAQFIAGFFNITTE